MSAAGKTKDDSQDTQTNGTSKARSASASPPIKINRKFETNPFRDRPLRCQFISNRHDAILKQFSSTHFRIPTSSHQLLSPHTAKKVDNIKNASGDDEHNTTTTMQDDSSSDEGAADIDVDDAEPYIFEFPYYLNSTKRNLVLMKEHFVQENRVDALKIAIQTSRFLIDDLVLSEPQFYPAIYVLVSKLLDSFGVLVYDRLFALTTCPSDSVHYLQNQHNFVPDATSNDAQTSNATHTQKPKPKETHHEEHSNHIERAIYGNDPENDYDDEKHQHFIQMQQQQQQTLENGDNKEVFPENFRASHCSHLCQIKCANWFFKISAIRELVPRTLVEIALYRTLRFIYPLPKFLEYTRMLMKRLRGIANPLIAAYVRIFALEQIFGTFGVSAFNYAHDHESDDVQHAAATHDIECDFDMIEDIYLMVLEDVLFIFKSMYDTKFKSVDCVFYGQMASEDYLNLFNPIFEMIFDILKYNQVLQNANDIKLYLNAKIDHNLLKLIDLNSFLGIKKSDPYVLNLDETKNVYTQTQTNKKRKKGAELDKTQINHIVHHDEDEEDQDEADDASDDSADSGANDKNNKLKDMARDFQNNDMLQ